VQAARCRPPQARPATRFHARTGRRRSGARHEPRQPEPAHEDTPPRRAARAGLKIALHKLFAKDLDGGGSTHDASRTTVDGTATRFMPRNVSSNTADECRMRSRERRLDDRVRLASSRIARRRRQKLDFETDAAAEKSLAFSGN